MVALTRSVRIAPAETGMATDEPILIKRYANRKLYDQGRSRYVTLEELEEFIRQGREIRVVDAVSGDDLTSQTLAQIILDTARGGRSALPVAFLHQLIQHGMTWQSFVQESLQSSLAGIAASQRETERALREWGVQAGWWPSEQGSTASGERCVGGGPPGGGGRAEGEDQGSRVPARRVSQGRGRLPGSPLRPSPRVGPADSIRRARRSP